MSVLETRPAAPAQAPVFDGFGAVFKRWGTSGVRLGIFRTQAFRIVLIYIVLFGVSASALIAFAYWNTTRTLDAQSDQVIEAEITGLSEQYQQLGLRGLAQLISTRAMHGGGGLYLLVDSGKSPVAGNLDGWPRALAQTRNVIEFDYERRVGNQSERRRARGRTFTLMGGFALLVAQDVQERYQMERLFTTTVPWTLALMLLLGLAGGGLLSRNMLARLDSINRTSKEIIAGDLSRRVPLSTAQDEFDELSANLNRMLDRIERLMSGVREVTDSVAHDLRTPLTRVRNRLEGALKQLESESGEAREIEAAVQETDQLIATFNALLLIAEADAGVAREAMMPVDLQVVARDVGELYGPVAEEKGIAFIIMPAPRSLIRGNQSLIAQVLANLVDNSIKYTLPGGRVVVSTRTMVDGVELSVADTGPGIPENERAHVTERFVRLEASRNSPGTGLGLSLVAAVARLHDTELKLEDNHPGLRATIRFRRALA